MKERPILFNSEMVRAILLGQKTQTRRNTGFERDDLVGIADPRDWALSLANNIPNGVTDKQIEAKVEQLKSGAMRQFRIESGGLVGYICPLGKVGDQLWVRETFQLGLCTESTIAYRATHKPEDLEDGQNEVIKWKPSIHMPRSLSRIQLEITGVRAERLNDITKADATSEGFDYPAAKGMSWKLNAIHNFRFTWNKIYKNWGKNPWVWVIEFKKI